MCVCVCGGGGGGVVLSHPYQLTGLCTSSTAVNVEFQGTTA